MMHHASLNHHRQKPPPLPQKSTWDRPIGTVQCLDIQKCCLYTNPRSTLYEYAWNSTEILVVMFPPCALKKAAENTVLGQSYDFLRQGLPLLDSWDCIYRMQRAVHRRGWHA